jgi:GxxExxY protein
MPGRRQHSPFPSGGRVKEGIKESSRYSNGLEPRMNTDRAAISELAELIIARALVVSNTLGSGFFERVYENALAYELRKAGLMVAQQHDIAVRYEGIILGAYKSDMRFENPVLVELKAVKILEWNHCAQCLNYLKATDLWLCLLLNFGNPRLAIKRLVNGR